MTNFLAANDPDVWSAVAAEVERQHDGLELIASENYTSPAVMQAAGSVLTNKYAEGYPGRRYYGGCEHVDVIEDLARNRVKQLFGCRLCERAAALGFAGEHGHLSGGARAGRYRAGARPLAHGGHLTHGMKLNISGNALQLCQLRRPRRRSPYRFRSGCPPRQRTQAEADRRWGKLPTLGRFLILASPKLPRMSVRS